jgi:energy-coupling factor transporter transmembrane protein EcfT
VLHRRDTANLVLWATRVAFRMLCWSALSVGRAMVALANSFRSCRAASVRCGVFVVPVQVVLLAAWIPVRLVFVCLESAARSAYRVDVSARRRWPLTETNSP